MSEAMNARKKPRVKLADLQPGKKNNSILIVQKALARVSKGRVTSPVPGYRISYRYGVRNPRYVAGYHTGNDYAAPVGTPVVAVRNGTIKWSDSHGGAYGNWIGLEAHNGRVYVYCHLSVRRVKKGQKVKAGQRLGLVGRTGNVTGPHLHFEDHPQGRFVYGQGRKPRW